VKVVLFCGGLGLRMREASERVPKPMVTIGGRPILWHVMKYFAHYGHTQFILCLGYKAEVIKDYFLTYNEALSNDFVLTEGGRNIELLRHDMQDWEITFVGTGLHTNVGQRLKAVQKHLGDDEMFLANYGDVLTDAHLPTLTSNLEANDKVGSFLCVKPNYTFHVVSLGDGDVVEDIQDITRSEIWINGGYFVFRNEIFDYIREGEDLVEEPFRRLVAEGRLLANKYEGFWAPMDTLKDQQKLEAMLENGNGPWRVWELGDDSTPSPGRVPVAL
jgi:glucose-1-phosphate cytidylyltransferase